MDSSANLPSSSQASGLPPSQHIDPSVASFSPLGYSSYPTSWYPQPQVISQTVAPVLSNTLSFTPPLSQCSAYSLFPPSPSPSSFPHIPRPTVPSAFTLCRIAGNISKPPYDLCIRHQEWREYTSPMSSVPQSRFGNVYYHFNPVCVQFRVHNFIPSTLHIPKELSAQLTSAHKLHLSAYFTISIP